VISASFFFSSISVWSRSVVELEVGDFLASGRLGLRLLLGLLAG
jgi:hypothetical protein